MNRTFTLCFLLYPIALPFGYVLVYTFYHYAVPDANSDLTLLNNHFDFGSILKVKLETVSNKQLILVFMVSDIALFRVHFTETQIAFQYYDGAKWTYIWQK